MCFLGKKKKKNTLLLLFSLSLSLFLISNFKAEKSCKAIANTLISKNMYFQDDKGSSLKVLGETSDTFLDLTVVHVSRESLPKCGKTDTYLKTLT